MMRTHAHRSEARLFTRISADGDLRPARDLAWLAATGLELEAVQTELAPAREAVAAGLDQ